MRIILKYGIYKTSSLLTIKYTCMKHVYTQAKLIILLICAQAVYAVAATYYVSATGSDSNTGTSTLAPWKTITKVNSINFQPGEIILFKRGDIFRGELAAKPGSVGTPVTYGAYGTGKHPVISGATQISSSGWALYQGNIYVKTGVYMRAHTEGESPNLFVNGKVLLPARFPIYPTTRYAQSVDGIFPNSHCCEKSWSFTDTSLGNIFTNSSDLIGGLVTAHGDFGIATREIKSYSPATGKVTMDTMHYTGFMTGKKYSLSSKLIFLDSKGEWYYDYAAKKLYVRLPNDAAPTANDTIEFSNYYHGINAWQVENIIVKDLEFRYQQISGVFLIRSDNSIVQNCKFYGSKHGVLGWGNASNSIKNVQIKNNTFENTLRTGINIKSNAEQVSINDNTFNVIGKYNGLAHSGNPDQWNDYGNGDYGIGIQLLGKDCYIQRNRIDSTGRAALTHIGNNVIAKYNVMDNSCLNYLDCGAIYVGATDTFQNGVTTHEQNIIRNSRARGIYNDFNDNDIIKNNTVVNCATQGMSAVNAKNCTYNGNTVYGTGEIALRQVRKSTGQLNNKIKNNIFFGLNHTQYNLLWNNEVSGPEDNSVIDSNKYWNPYSYFPVIKYKDDASVFEIWYDLKSWKDLSGWTKDDHSKKEFVFMNIPYRINSLTGTEKVVNGNFSSSGSNWTTGGSMTASYPTTIYGMSGRCAQIEYNGNYEGGKLYQSGISVSYNKYYKVTFTLKSSASIAGKRVQVSILQNGNAVYQRHFKADTVAQTYTCVFKAPSSQVCTLEYWVSGTPATGEYHYIDNVSIIEANVQYLDPGYKFPIFINDSSVTKNFNIAPYTYLTLDSSAITSGNISIPAYSSRILVRTGVMLTINGPIALCPNDSVTLSVASGFLSYQWYRNGLPVLGATSSSLIIKQPNTGLYYCKVSESNGYEWNSQQQNITTQQPSACQTSVDENGNNSHVLVFPNPANNETNIYINNNKKEEVEICLYAPNGQLLYSAKEEQQGPAAHTIDLSTRAQGFYIVVIKTKNTITTRKLQVIK